MKIIDTHAHYDDRWFDEDRYEVLDRILSDYVLAIINMSVDIPTCEFSCANMSMGYALFHMAH